MKGTLISDDPASEAQKANARPISPPEEREHDCFDQKLKGAPHAPPPPCPDPDWIVIRSDKRAVEERCVRTAKTLVGRHRSSSDRRGKNAHFEASEIPDQDFSRKLMALADA